MFPIESTKRVAFLTSNTRIGSEKCEAKLGYLFAINNTAVKTSALSIG